MSTTTVVPYVAQQGDAVAPHASVTLNSVPSVAAAPMVSQGSSLPIDPTTGKLAMVGVTVVTGGALFGIGLPPDFTSLISSISTATVIASAFNRIFSGNMVPGLHDDISFVITVAASVGLLQLAIGECAKQCSSNILRQLYLSALAVTTLAVVLKVVSAEAMNFMTIDMAYRHIASAKEFLRNAPGNAATHAKEAWQQLLQSRLFSLLNVRGERDDAGDINYSMVGSCVSLALSVVTGYLSVQSCLTAEVTLEDIVKNMKHKCSGTTKTLAITSVVLGVTGFLGVLFSGPMRYLPRLQMDIDFEANLQRLKTAGGMGMSGLRATGKGLLALGSHVLSGAKQAAGGARALAGQISSSASSLEPPPLRRSLAFFLLASGVAVGVVDAFVDRGDPAKETMFYTAIALCILGVLTAAHGATRHRDMLKNLRMPNAGPVLRSIWDSVLSGASGVTSAMMQPSACDQVLAQLRPIREELNQIRAHLLDNDAPNENSWGTFSHPSGESEPLFDEKVKKD